MLVEVLYESVSECHTASTLPSGQEEQEFQAFQTTVVFTLFHDLHLAKVGSLDGLWAEVVEALLEHTESAGKKSTGGTSQWIESQHLGHLTVTVKFEEGDEEVVFDVV